MTSLVLDMEKYEEEERLLAIKQKQEQEEKELKEQKDRENKAISKVAKYESKQRNKKK